MTVKRFESDYSRYGERIQVKSGYNGKILCKKFDKKKHIEISEREVVTIEPEISVSDGKFAHAFITLWVNGEPEYQKEKGLKNES